MDLLCEGGKERRRWGRRGGQEGSSRGGQDIGDVKMEEVREGRAGGKFKREVRKDGDVRIEEVREGRRGGRK